MVRRFAWRFSVKWGYMAKSEFYKCRGSGLIVCGL